MLYYSTSLKKPGTSLREAVERGLAPEGGLYMPERFPRIPKAFFKNLPLMSIHDVGYVVSNLLFGDEISSQIIKEIVDSALTFDYPLVEIEKGISSLELYHGPTLSFKDTGARFMARLLSKLLPRGERLNVLVATSGDSGGAVSNAFFRLDNINVYVLFPSGKISRTQQTQFTTLGSNIHPIEIYGTFDDCQSLVKQAFVDRDLTSRINLTSANSINIARLFPQSFYYFYGWGQAVRNGADPDNVVISVPSGNLGNLTAGLFARRMGLPVKRFIAANNRNDIFASFLRDGVYSPRKSVPTIANAMDVGNPSNFDRIMDLYGGSADSLRADVEGYTSPDQEIVASIKSLYQRSGYLMDPHGATAYNALKNCLRPGETGVFLETADPSKFPSAIEPIIGHPLPVPAVVSNRYDRLQRRERIEPKYNQLKNILLKMK